MIPRDTAINYLIALANEYHNIPMLKEAMRHFEISKEELQQHPAATEIGSCITKL